MSCQEAFSLGMYYVVQNIHQRRYTVVDRERGVVYAHSVLDQGTVNSGTLSDGRPHSYAGFNRPSSILVTEAFLIEDGKFRSIEMVGPSAPYHINSPLGRPERELTGRLEQERVIRFENLVLTTTL